MRLTIVQATRANDALPGPYTVSSLCRFPLLVEPSLHLDRDTGLAANAPLAVGLEPVAVLGLCLVMAALADGPKHASAGVLRRLHDAKVFNVRAGTALADVVKR